MNRNTINEKVEQLETQIREVLRLDTIVEKIIQLYKQITREAWLVRKDSLDSYEGNLERNLKSILLWRGTAYIEEMKKLVSTFIELKHEAEHRKLIRNEIISKEFSFDNNETEIMSLRLKPFEDNEEYLNELIKTIEPFSYPAETDEAIEKQYVNLMNYLKISLALAYEGFKKNNKYSPYKESDRIILDNFISSIESESIYLRNEDYLKYHAKEMLLLGATPRYISQLKNYFIDHSALERINNGYSEFLKKEQFLCFVMNDLICGVVLKGEDIGELDELTKEKANQLLSKHTVKNGNSGLEVFSNLQELHQSLREKGFQEFLVFDYENETLTKEAIKREVINSNLSYTNYNNHNNIVKGVLDEKLSREYNSRTQGELQKENSDKSDSVEDSGSDRINGREREQLGGDFREHIPNDYSKESRREYSVGSLSQDGQHDISVLSTNGGDVSKGSEKTERERSALSGESSSLSGYARLQRAIPHIKLLLETKFGQERARRDFLHGFERLTQSLRGGHDAKARNGEYIRNELQGSTNGNRDISRGDGGRGLYGGDRGEDILHKGETRGQNGGYVGRHLRDYGVESREPFTQMDGETPRKYMQSSFEIVGSELSYDNELLPRESNPIEPNDMGQRQDETSETQSEFTARSQENSQKDFATSNIQRNDSNGTNENAEPINIYSQRRNSNQTRGMESDSGFDSNSSGDRNARDTGDNGEGSGGLLSENAGLDSLRRARTSAEANQKDNIESTQASKESAGDSLEADKNNSESTELTDEAQKAKETIKRYQELSPIDDEAIKQIQKNDEALKEFESLNKLNLFQKYLENKEIPPKLAEKRFVLKIFKDFLRVLDRTLKANKEEKNEEYYYDKSGFKAIDEAVEWRLNDLLEDYKKSVTYLLDEYKLNNPRSMLANKEFRTMSYALSSLAKKYRIEIYKIFRENRDNAETRETLMSAEADKRIIKYIQEEKKPIEYVALLNQAIEQDEWTKQVDTKDRYTYTKMLDALTESDEYARDLDLFYGEVRGWVSMKGEIERILEKAIDNIDNYEKPLTKDQENRLNELISHLKAVNSLEPERKWQKELKEMRDGMLKEQKQEINEKYEYLLQGLKEGLLKLSNSGTAQEFQEHYDRIENTFAKEMESIKANEPFLVAFRDEETNREILERIKEKEAQRNEVQDSDENISKNEEEKLLETNNSLQELLNNNGIDNTQIYTPKELAKAQTETISNNVDSEMLEYPQQKEESSQNNGSIAMEQSEHKSKEFIGFSSGVLKKRFTEHPRYSGKFKEDLTKTERIKANLEAIKTLVAIFTDMELQPERLALYDKRESEILAQYTGFGGLKDFFL